MKALYTATGAMVAQQTHIDVIAHNISNLNTTGYKKREAKFSDLMYQTINREPIKQHRGQSVVSYQNAHNIQSKLEVGLGTKLESIDQNLTQGSVNKTNNQLDVYLNGIGYITVYDTDDTPSYTRNGALKINSEGHIVSSNNKKLNLKGGVIVPLDSVKIYIHRNGDIFSADKNNTKTQIGHIQIAEFLNPVKLTPKGNGEFIENGLSGEAIYSNKNTQIEQGNLESSNVDPMTEITQLILGQNTYEFCAKVVESISSIMQTTININK